MIHIQPSGAPSTVVTLHGPIADDLAPYVREKIDTVLRHAGRPVLSATVVLTRHQDPARSNPVTAHANIDVNGHLIRLEVEAATPRAAVDSLVDGLRGRLNRIGRGWRYRHRHRDLVVPID